MRDPEFINKLQSLEPTEIVNFYIETKTGEEAKDTLKIH